MKPIWGPAETPAADAGGPDIGWALACLGLLLAAALLGRPGDGQGSGAGAGTKLRALLRPPLGGR
jgi:hypothetical protein